MAFEPHFIELYNDSDVQIGKEAHADEYLYVLQEEFEETDVIELNKVQQLALYVILKNRFEA
jgi:hypothetical protein